MREDDPRDALQLKVQKGCLGKRKRQPKAALKDRPRNNNAFDTSALVEVEVKAEPVWDVDQGSTFAATDPLQVTVVCDSESEVERETGPSMANSTQLDFDSLTVFLILTRPVFQEVC